MPLNQLKILTCDLKPGPGSAQQRKPDPEPNKASETLLLQADLDTILSVKVLGNLERHMTMLEC